MTTEKEQQLIDEIEELKSIEWKSQIRGEVYNKQDGYSAKKRRLLKEAELKSFKFKGCNKVLEIRGYGQIRTIECGEVEPKTNLQILCEECVVKKDKLNSRGKFFSSQP